jgi:hypothetical protein
MTSKDEIAKHDAVLRKLDAKVWIFDKRKDGQVMVETIT